MLEHCREVRYYLLLIMGKSLQVHLPQSKWDYPATQPTGSPIHFMCQLWVTERCPWGVFFYPLCRNISRIFFSSMFDDWCLLPTHLCSAIVWHCFSRGAKIASQAINLFLLLGDKSVCFICEHLPGSGAKWNEWPSVLGGSRTHSLLRLSYIKLCYVCSSFPLPVNIAFLIPLISNPGDCLYLWSHLLSSIEMTWRHPKDCWQ